MPRQDASFPEQLIPSQVAAFSSPRSGRGRLAHRPLGRSGLSQQGSGRLGL